MASNTMELVPWLRQQPETEDGNVLAEIVKTFAKQLVAARADALCGAGAANRLPRSVSRGHRPTPAVIAGASGGT